MTSKANEVLSLLAKEFPGFALRVKQESRFMRLLGWMLRPLLPGFMTQHITTIWNTIYVPEGLLDNPGLWALLLHERQHLRATVASRIVLILGYLFPQILALGVVGAVATPWAWLFLVFLAPWPAWFRLREEARGYAHWLWAVTAARGGKPDWRDVHWIVNHLTGKSYYYAWWPSRLYALRVLSQEYHKAEDDLALYRIATMDAASSQK